MDATRKLKELQTELAQQTKELSKFHDNKAAIERHISACKREINKINGEIKNLAKKEIVKGPSGNFVVSEHAIVRYFERVKGYNLEEIKKAILSNETNGVPFRKKILDGVVVTIET